MKEVYGVVVKPFYYPHNSIRETTAYEKLLDNTGRIPIEEIEKLLEKYNCP